MDISSKRNFLALKMFMKDEINLYRTLYEEIKEVQLDSFLGESDIETIVREGHYFRHGKDTKSYMGVPVTIKNLQNQLVVPKNTLRHCTVTFKRLMDGHNYDDWLHKIAKILMFSEETDIQVAFSFLCWIPKTGEQTYIFAAKELSPFRFTVDNQSDLLTEFKKLGSMTEREILDKTFIETQSDNPFASSGFCPQQLVCSYVYVTK